jgi:hypothetical protein
MLKSNHSSSQGGNKLSGMNVSMASFSRLFRTPTDWFSVNEWNGDNASKLRRTYQYVTFKTKLFETFESFGGATEDAYSLIWLELFKYYRGDMRLFPTKKYIDIWESLTIT